MSRRRGALLAVSSVLGLAAALGAAGCGDDERGGVEVQGAGTSTSGGSATTTAPAGTTTAPAGTDTAPAGTETTGTSPEPNTSTETTP